MATILNQNGQATILGDEPDQKPKTTADPRSASTERRDTAILGATGELPEDTELTVTDISNRVNTALASSVSKYIEEEKDVEEAAEDIEDQAKKGADLISLTDYFDNSFHAMDNPTLSAAANLSSIKYQLTVEKLTDAIQERTAETGAGTVINWFDRYILRQFPIGAFEQVRMKRKNVSEEFARAIAGNMSVEEYNTLLDTKIEEYLNQGILFSDNPFAASELLQTIEEFGNDDLAVAEAILAATDLFPIAGGVVSIGGKAVKAGKKVSEVRKIAKALNDISKSPTAATRAGALNGAEAATDVAEKIAKKTDDPENLASMGPSIVDPISDNAPVRPLGSAAANNHTATRLTQEVFEYTRRFLGDIYDTDLINTYITTRVNNIAQSINRGVMDIKLNQEQNSLTMLFGNPKTGKPMTKKAAERYIEDMPEASIVPMGNNRFAVQVSEVVPMDNFIKTNKYAELLKIEGVTGKWFAKLFQKLPTTGYHLIDNADATNLAYRSESAAVRIGQLSKPYIDKINKLSAREIDDVSDIIKNLQSGDLASQRNWFTDDDFADRWAALHQGQEPSQKVIDGYRALVDLADHTYQLRATSMLRRMQANGYRRIVVKVGGEDTYLAAKKVDKIPDDVKWFIDAQTGARFTRDDYDGPIANIFKTDMDIGGNQYVVDTRVVRPLEPEDVLGYNAGGPRVNPEATDFIVLLDKDNKPLKVALSASSSKSAAKARDQLNKLYLAKKAGVLTDDLLVKNNDWNKSLTTVEEFDVWLDESKIYLDKDDLKFVSKHRDESVFSISDDDAFVPNASLTEFAIYSNRRNDKPLTHFGGLGTANDSPIGAILNQVNTESRRLAFSYYNDAIQVSLGKKVKQIADPNSSSKDYRKYYRDMEKWLDVSKTTDPVIRKLHDRKRITELRMGAEGFGDRWAQRLADSASNLIYDIRGVKFNVDNPSHLLTNYGFKTTFFADPFQMLLQSAHSINIVAMAGLEDGLQGAVMGNYLLKSLKLDGKELDIMLDRMGKQFGYSKKEMTEIRQLFIDSARYEVDPTNIAEGFQAPTNSLSRAREKGTRVAMNTLNKGWEKTMNAGMYFFNKGEQITRVTSFGAAVRKWKAQNPELSILSPEGRAWVINKEQAYSLNMTNMSKGDVQQGLLRIPTQFYSYMLRSFEGIFIGKDLTKAERMKLAVMVGPFFGMTGVGLGNGSSAALDAMNSYLPDSLQLESGGDVHRLIKNGPVDALFAWADDKLFGDIAPEVSAASRLSLGDGVIDTFRHYRDANVFEIIGGAGGGKAGSTLVDFAQILGSIARGDEILIGERTLELFRNFKFIDNLAKAKGIIQNQIYSSKSGKRFDANFTTMDGIFAAVGIPLEEVQTLYDADDIIYNNQKVYREYSKEIDNRINLFWDAINERDAEKANEILTSIELSVSRMTGLPPELRGKLQKQVMQGFSDTTTFERVDKLRTMGLDTEAESLLNITR